jgi:signal transduction histidine kinase
MREYDDRLDENGKMYIDRIQRNSERMATLIDDLLELSRIGRIKGEEELVDISDVISDVADELASQLEERGTKLIVKDKMPAIWCDRTRMSQIFANLISNANKYTGEDNAHPTVEVGYVGYEGQDNYHTFYVKDNGIGIDKEYHEKIFQIFQRLDDIQTEGTGVGLTIVKKIVGNFGGEIWVDSAKGEGTTVYFTMPRAEEQRAESVEQRAKSSEVPTLSP